MKQELMTVVSQTLLAPRIYELVLTGDLVAEMTRPGQFLHVLVGRADLLLRRPISLAAIDHEKKQCTIIYRVEGDGTASLSELVTGEKVDILGPLGNGFDISEVKKDEIIYIIGGGIGVPPLYELSNQIAKKGAKIIHLFGFQTAEVRFYEEKFKENGTVYIATDDGSYGVKGNVGHLLTEQLKQQQPAAVYACGARGLLQVVEKEFHDHPRAFMSLEERMACGTGACYACVCHLQSDPTGKASKKICDEGPIFPTGEVVL